ncbi:MAG: nitroreductase family protein [Coriobacteriia bacterium]|nr:nitroreductase family protein [Coriobacteriia bacterium]MBN2839854.1 nitroreductase family protein [Coriobacteriia bacterium]
MDVTKPGPLTNPTLELIAQRSSTRTYDPAPLTDDERQAILHAALRAPTGGNMVLYSIIEVEEQALKERLAVACDDQPFIATAPWVLVFAADWQKWTDLFAVSDVEAVDATDHRTHTGPGDLFLACADAIIAAQTAVIAAESLGIGSCYIGDIIENGEEVAGLLHLPPHTFPAAMVCFGRPRKRRAPIGRYGRGLVHRDRYRRRTGVEAAEVVRELAELHAPSGLPEGVANYAQAVYRRKFASAFMAEMNRSATWWLERWTSGGR